MVREGVLRESQADILRAIAQLEDFESAMNERESTMLRAYNSLGLSRSGRMTQEDVKKSLKRLGLPATDENATAMLKHLDL